MRVATQSANACPRVASGPMSFQVHHGRRRGSTRAVTAPAFPPDPRPSTAAAQPRETVATAHGGSRDEPLRRPAAFGGSSSVGSLNNQLRAMRATAPSRRSHRDVLLAPLPPAHMVSSIALKTIKRGCDQSTRCPAHDVPIGASSIAVVSASVSGSLRCGNRASAPLSST